MPLAEVGLRIVSAYESCRGSCSQRIPGDQGLANERLAENPENLHIISLWKEKDLMTVSLIIGIVVVAAAIILYYVSAKKQRRRLDNLHITGAENDDK